STCSAAEQVERSAGPDAALAAFRPLLAKLDDGDAKERAVIGALRCAVRGAHPSVVAELLPWWSSVRGEQIDRVIDWCRALIARGRADLAADLAREELGRRPTAWAAYLLARCLEAVGDPAATSAYALAADRA